MRRSACVYAQLLHHLVLVRLDDGHEPVLVKFVPSADALFGILADHDSTGVRAVLDTIRLTDLVSGSGTRPCSMPIPALRSAQRCAYSDR
jgi:hypothetical protein